jgi:hypothetical protein
MNIQVILLTQSVFLLSLGSPVPSPSPLLPSLTSIMGPLVALMQTTAVGGGGAAAGGAAGGAAAGGAAAGGAAAGAGGAAIAPIVAGTVGTAAAPAMMAALGTLLPGIGLGLLKGIFLGNYTHSVPFKVYIFFSAELFKSPPKSPKAKGHGHHQAYGYQQQQPQYGYKRIYSEY